MIDPRNVARLPKCRAVRKLCRRPALFLWLPRRVCWNYWGPIQREYLLSRRNFAAFTVKRLMELVNLFMCALGLGRLAVDEQQCKWSAIASDTAITMFFCKHLQVCLESQIFLLTFCTRQVGSGNPGDPKAYDGIILRREGSWYLNGSSGKYSFDPSSGWLSGGGEKHEKLGRFICKQIQDRPLELPVTSYSKLASNFQIVSSEIMLEIQKPENAGALFVLPSQLNGAEYPSHTHVVKYVEEYKSDNTGWLGFVACFSSGKLVVDIVVILQAFGGFLKWGCTPNHPCWSCW